jgi:uncharacterized membrane protein
VDALKTQSSPAIELCGGNSRLLLTRGAIKSAVVAVILLCFTAKLYIAAVTFGTNDIRTWMDFAQAVKAVGPIRVYSYPFAHDLYNHPPLVGYILLLFNLLSRIGLPLAFTLRALSSLSDVASALLAYVIIRKRRSETEALASALLIGSSPILFIVSGFHGNTDPIFMMLVLLGLFLLADRQSPYAAGIIMAAAVSIKLVPALVIPAMCAYAYRTGRRTCLRFCLGLTSLLCLLWIAPLLSQWTSFRHNVLGYTGIDIRWWGIPQIAAWAGSPTAGAYIAAHGSVILVASIATICAALTLRRPSCLVEASALALCSFLLLSPASATQYLVWAVGPAYLLGVARATLFNLSGGALLFAIYNRWSGGFPWNVAVASTPTTDERMFACIVWLTLLIIVSSAYKRISNDTVAPRDDVRRPGERPAGLTRTPHAPMV